MTNTRTTRSAAAAAATETRSDVLDRHHFRLLDFERQLQVVRRLAAAGFNEFTIADITGVAVAQLRLLMDGDQR